MTTFSSKFNLATSLLTILLFVSGINGFQLQGQSYYPNGDPEKWNVKLTPYVILPWVSGNLEVGPIGGGSTVTPSTIVSDLKMVCMVQAEVSKGKFYTSANYFYTKLGTESTDVSGPLDEMPVESTENLTLNDVDFELGLQLQSNPKWSFNPVVGFRYTNLAMEVALTGYETATENTTFHLWDPIIGLNITYFPAERVPVLFKADFGGLASSDFTWSASLSSGYSVSPTIDLLGGFSAFGFSYNTDLQVRYRVQLGELAVALYGFDFGIRINLPKRLKDASVFPKKANK